MPPDSREIARGCFIWIDLNTLIGLSEKTEQFSKISNIAIAATPVATNQGFKSVVPYDLAMSPYLFYCLKAITDDIIQRATGTTFKEISGSEMAETIIPLPPIHEQQRIFKKATRLFEVITTIEKSLS